MKKTIFFVLLITLAVHLISCKKSELKNSVVDNSTATKSEKEMINTESSANESGQNKIDYDWSKMNYNMLSSLIFDIQINPKKYNNKRFKLSGSFYTSIYEEKRYYSILIWDPTGCCPAGFDFLPPVDMNFLENSLAPTEQITIIGILNPYEDDGTDYLIFQAEEIIRNNN